MKKAILSILFLNIIMILNAENNDLLTRSSDKFYVVIGVIGIIFLMIVLFLIRIERKLSKLEKKNL